MAREPVGTADTPMSTSLGVERLEVLVLPYLAVALAEMKAAGVVDPVSVLRRLQGGIGDEPEEIRQHEKVFRMLRGTFTYDDNAQILEMAMRRAITLCASVVI